MFRIVQELRFVVFIFLYVVIGGVSLHVHTSYHVNLLSQVLKLSFCNITMIQGLERFVLCSLVVEKK
jgi:hypothetical protein